MMASCRGAISETMMERMKNDLKISSESPLVEGTYYCGITGNRCSEEDMAACEEYSQAVKDLKFPPMVYV
jgi:hypothetical protein